MFSKILQRHIRLVKPFPGANRKSLSTKNPFLFQVSNFTVKTINVPFMGDSISEGKIVEFSKSVNDYTQQDEVVAVIETDKTNLEISSPESGIIRKFHHSVDTIVKVDVPLFDIDIDGKTKDAEPTSTNDSVPKDVSEKDISEKDISEKDISEKESVEKEVKTEKIEPLKKKVTVEKKEASNMRGIRRVPLSRMRLKIAARLKESQNTAASLTTFNEIDCTNLLKLKNDYKEKFLKQTKQKLGFMSPFVKASTLALQRYPEINAYFDGPGAAIEFHDFVDVSVAVAGPKGLVVPVLRNTELMSFADIESKIKSFVEKAKTGKLLLEEMQGGTFTISNSGVFKSLIGTPIINPPQSAVLGLYGIFDTPVAIDGKVEIRPVMKVALSYDHRVVDGREAVLFLRAVKEYIEDPLSMVIM